MTRPDESRIRDIIKNVVVGVCVLLLTALSLRMPSLGGCLSPVKMWPFEKKIDKFNFCCVIIVPRDITVCILAL